MKEPNELKTVLKSFVICVFICLFVMFALMGFFKAQSNSEYALNGKESEYVTSPFGKVKMSIIISNKKCIDGENSIAGAKNFLKIGV